MNNWRVGSGCDATSLEEFFDNDQIFIIPPGSPSDETGINGIVDPLNLDDSYLILENGDFIEQGELIKPTC